MRNNKIINKGKINALIFRQILPTDYFSCSLYYRSAPLPDFFLREGGWGVCTQVRSITIGDKILYQKKWTAENELTISFVDRLHDVMHSEKRLTLVFEYCDQVRQSLIAFYTHSVKK